MQLGYLMCCPGTLCLEKLMVSQLYSLKLCFLSVKYEWQKSQPWSAAEVYIRLCCDEGGCIIMGNCTRGSKRKKKEPLLKCRLHPQCDMSLDLHSGLCGMAHCNVFIAKYRRQELVHKNNKAKNCPPQVNKTAGVHPWTKESRGGEILVSHPFSLQDMSPPLHMLLLCRCNPGPMLGKRLLLSITLPLGGTYLANVPSFLLSLPLFPKEMHILAGSVSIQIW